MSNLSLALTWIGALAACDSAGCVERGVAPARAAVESAERHYGPTDAALVGPLTGLANSLIASGQPAEAIEPLTRAVGILRRNAGLYDKRQYALLSQLTDLHSAQGDLADAFAALAYMERVSERAHGRQSVEHARSLSEIATWQCRLGRFDHGRQRFRRSIERLHGQNEQEHLIDALLGLARCSFDELAAEGVATAAGSLEDYRGPVVLTNRMSAESPTFQMRVMKILRVDGELAMRRAAQLAETAQLTPARRAAVLVQVGDWFQSKSHSRTARKYYASAQRWMLRTGSGEDPLGAPAQVLYPVPPLALRNQLSREQSAAERYVEVELTVLADGSVDVERVIVREPGKSAADETLQALRVARFRPRMVEGNAVDTAGLRFRQSFK